MISRLILFIKRFFYYGYYGAKLTRDYDASGLHNLVYAHINRVNTFMHDPKLTHLKWNSNPQNKNMRLLRELKELSSRFMNDSISGYYFDRVYNSTFSCLGSNPIIRKRVRIALKKDQMVKKGLEDRYWYLLRYKAPEFWD